MVEIRIEMSAALNNLNNLPRRLQRAETAVLRRVGDDAVQRAKAILQAFDYVDTGKAINSIFRKTSFTGSTFNLTVWSNVLYSKYLDEGAAKHFVSFFGGRGARRTLLIAWAIRHGIIEQVGGKLVNARTGKPMRGLKVGLEKTGYITDSFQEAKLKFVEESGRVI